MFDGIHHIRCIISDVRMPGLSGPQLQETLNKMAIRLPIIFITAYVDDPTKARALAAGAVGFLPKPVAADALLSCIYSALGNEVTDEFTSGIARNV